VDALKADLPNNIELIEVDTHIEDPAFAVQAAQLLIELIEAKSH
jgi:hypothetical protein